MNKDIEIRKQDPLKQGLKQIAADFKRSHNHHSKARSTKTRIETPNLSFCRLLPSEIRKQDPLKQGLKHCIISRCIADAQVFESKIH